MSSNYETFRAVAHMKGDAILQGDLTLESLLAACVHDETEKIRDEALALVPLESIETPEGAIWSASGFMVDGRFKETQHTVVRGRSISEIGPDFYDGNPRAWKDPWAVAQNNGPYKRLMNVYTLTHSSRLVWYGKGDIAECKRLLDTQHWLGKRRGSGMGEVAEFTVTPWSGNPLVDPHGMVRRPVALRKLQFLPGALPPQRQRIIHTVDRHPAWLHDAELCAVPPSRLEPRELPEMYFED